MSATSTNTPLITVRGLLGMQGVVEEDHLSFPLFHAGDPVTLVEWTSDPQHELRAQGVPFSTRELHEAQQTARKYLCATLRIEGWSFRKIAKVLGLHLRQAERWGGGS